jgi:hypothetical protein
VKPGNPTPLWYVLVAVLGIATCLASMVNPCASPVLRVVLATLIVIYPWCSGTACGPPGGAHERVRAVPSSS